MHKKAQINIINLEVYKIELSVFIFTNSKLTNK